MNSHMPAMPVFDHEARLCVVRDPDTGRTKLASGLTKREHTAIVAMQGLLSAPSEGEQVTSAQLITKSVALADALLAELGK
ncbi:hypothetical protein NVP1210O_04 [Vibrio phage 1.210.O._10N.222.52.C2]|nr:hypothetical protein NVP1210O_04 [Vibrio phage 1.210.O._10N.222.52.C2]